MNKAEFYAYHIVTRKTMSIGQIIHFDKNQTNTLYHFFFEREQLNSNDEDSIQILKRHYINEELHINNENAKVVLNYMIKQLERLEKLL